ncbi:hypothetical protein GBA52_018071 [Prunus armeniaca]|nr:hypothetical protein GBA52_018071 [Prunus armeniaca]
MLMTRASLCCKSRPIRSFFWKPDHRIVFCWWKVGRDLGDHSGLFDLPLLFLAGHSRLLGVG